MALVKFIQGHPHYEGAYKHLVDKLDWCQAMFGQWNKYCIFHEDIKCVINRAIVGWKLLRLSRELALAINSK